MEDGLPNTTDSPPTTSAFYSQPSGEEGNSWSSSETEKYLTINFNETSLELESAENSTISSTTTLDPAAKQALLKKMNQRKQFRPAKYFLPTGEYVTQRPPPQYGGCTTRNVDGEWIVHYKDSLFRQYHDWSGVCSSWCQCTANETIDCHPLTCLSDVLCEALHTTVRVGERLYLEGRGACLCHSGRFICDTSEELLDLQPGLYISLGYSKEELEIIKEKVPKPLLEKSGLVSPMGSVAKDIASRMQFALERVLPKNTMCRIAVLDHFPVESVIMLQLQWYGVDRMANETQPRWHVGKLEKQCSPYVRELEHNFLLEKSDRYQLVLSTVKQLKVVDLLDGLTPAALLGPVASSSVSKCKSLMFVSSSVCTSSLYTLLCALFACKWIFRALVDR
uniref:Uncharacterized protein n=1 Tax=Ditylenchus dipsaci TaxID=166011 RepID=A0A915E225_9BILA